jgi:hypothetical protein
VDYLVNELSFNSNPNEIIAIGKQRAFIEKEHDYKDR